jgi:hypothetical protein
MASRQRTYEVIPMIYVTTASKQIPKPYLPAVVGVRYARPREERISMGWDMNNPSFYTLVPNAILGILVIFMAAILINTWVSVVRGNPAEMIELSAGIYQSSKNPGQFYQVFPTGFVLLDPSGVSKTTCNATKDIKNCLWGNLQAWATIVGANWSDIITSTTSITLQYQSVDGFFPVESPGTVTTNFPVKWIVGAGALGVVIIYLISVICSAWKYARYTNYTCEDQDKVLEGVWASTGFVVSLFGTTSVFGLMGGAIFQVYFVLASAITAMELSRWIFQRYINKVDFNNKSLAYRALQIGIQTNRLVWIYGGSMLTMASFITAKIYNYGIALDNAGLPSTTTSGLPLISRSLIWTFLWMYFMGSVILNYVDVAIRVTLFSKTQRTIDIHKKVTSEKYVSVCDFMLWGYWNVATCCWAFQDWTEDKLRRSYRALLVIACFWVQFTYFIYAILILIYSTMPANVTASYPLPPS